MSIEVQMKALADANQALSEAVLSLVDVLKNTNSTAPAASGKTKDAEEESAEVRYFHRKSNGELIETDDEKEIKKLVKARGVDEVDADEYAELVEAKEEAEAEKVARLEKAKAEKAAEAKKSKSKSKVEDEDEDDLDDDLDDELDEEEELTKDQVKTILKQLKDEKGPLAVKNIFKKIGIDKFDEIEESHFSKAYSMAEKALGA